MSARLISSRGAIFARRAAISTSSHRIARIHNVSAAGSLLRSEAALRILKKRSWPLGSSALHNVPAVRQISFSRVIPKLVTKLTSLTAMAGGAVVAGLSYIQYQATQASNYAVDIWTRAKDGATGTGRDLFNAANGILDQTQRGWERTKQDIEIPVWLQNVFSSEDSSEGGGGKRESGQSEHTKQSGVGTGVAGATTAAAFGYDSRDDGKEDSTGPPMDQIARDEQMMLLTKKMIEIRGLLQTVGQSDSLTLPSIVVIGSQSSGKSSVLEAIVGHEFLPKGSNMVTRRPIELTLVNTPNAQAEYGEFPSLGLGKITDFSQIQRTLTDLNLAVPTQECVSDDPVQLRIYSPNVPDLSLIDLPGYIQVVGRDQPAELKEKIAELCEKYIRQPNIILAISAADVDLANSTALRASRKVDPRGERTIGVITKMDLVDPTRAVDMLKDKKYALRLGYIGVVCRIPQMSTGLFNRGSSNIQTEISKNENAYFSSHPAEFGSDSGINVGTRSLKKRLMYVLEQTMAASLKTTGESIQRELAEATYEFKVQYNERPLSADSYLAESLDSFKHSLKSFTDQFGRSEVCELLKHELDQQVLNILAQRYWNRPLDDLSPVAPELDPLSALPKADPENPLWHLKLDSSSAALTKLGIGRLATAVVANALQARIDQLISNSTFAAHPFARQAITEASTTILKDLAYEISDELEICIKPYKYRIDIDSNEWAKGRENISRVLKDELKACEAASKHIEGEIGGWRRTKEVIGFIDRVRNGQVVIEGSGIGGAGGFSAALLSKGREAVFLRDRMDVLKMRLLAVKSKQCADKKNKYYCPEVFLDAVADKLTSTADLFLDAELLSKFYYLLPRELDSRLGRSLSQAEIDRFAREDPKIQRHLDVVRRKDLLEHVLKELEALRQLEVREKRLSSSDSSSGSGRSGRNRGRGWTIF